LASRPLLSLAVEERFPADLVTYEKTLRPAGLAVTSHQWVGLQVNIQNALQAMNVKFETEGSASRREGYSDLHNTVDEHDVTSSPRRF
jgi:hypothetical protein